jgi:hypothetical protein
MTSSTLTTLAPAQLLKMHFAGSWQWFDYESALGQRAFTDSGKIVADDLMIVHV